MAEKDPILGREIALTPCRTLTPSWSNLRLAGPASGYFSKSDASLSKVVATMRMREGSGGRGAAEETVPGKEDAEDSEEVAGREEGSAGDS